MNKVSFSPSSAAPNDPFCNALSYSAQTAENIGMFLSTAGLLTKGIPIWLSGKVLSLADSYFCRQNSLSMVLEEQKMTLRFDLIQWAVVGLHQLTFQHFENLGREYQSKTDREIKGLERLSESASELVTKASADLNGAKKSSLFQGTAAKRKRARELVQQHESSFNDAQKILNKHLNEITTLTASASTYLSNFKRFASAALFGAQAGLTYGKHETVEKMKKSHYQELYDACEEMAQTGGFSIQNATTADNAISDVYDELTRKMNSLFHILEHYVKVFKEECFAKEYGSGEKIPTAMRSAFVKVKDIYLTDLMMALQSLTMIPKDEFVKFAQMHKLTKLLIHPSNQLLSLLEFIVNVRERLSPTPSDVIFNGFPVFNTSKQFVQRLISVFEAVDLCMYTYQLYLNRFEGNPADNIETFSRMALGAFKRMEEQFLLLRKDFDAFLKN